MTHECQIENSSSVCIEMDGKLWVRQNPNEIMTYGSIIPVKFCPECGFKLPNERFFNSATIPFDQGDESIHKFSAELGKAIAQMNHNISIFKAHINSQNCQNECFLEREMELSKKLHEMSIRIDEVEICLKRR